MCFVVFRNLVIWLWFWFFFRNLYESLGYLILSVSCTFCYYFGYLDCVEVSLQYFVAQGTHPLTVHSSFKYSQPRIIRITWDWLNLSGLLEIRITLELFSVEFSL